jgi:hypothetical protein
VTAKVVRSTTFIDRDAALEAAGLWELSSAAWTRSRSRTDSVQGAWQYALKVLDRGCR